MFRTCVNSIITVTALAACNPASRDFDGGGSGSESSSSSGAGGFGGSTVSGTSSSGSGGSCPIGLADCDNDPTDCEVLLSQDPKHCGACNRDCLGGECVNGVCAPVLVADKVSFPDDVALDSDYVYWTSQDGVFRAPTSGGSPFNFAPGTSAAGIALNASNIYWTVPVTGPGEATGQVWTMPLIGGAATALASPQRVPARMSASQEAIFWTNTASAGGAGEVVRAKPDGSSQSIIFTNGSGPHPFDVALDDSAVYWTEQNWCTIYKWPTLGGMWTKLHSEQGSCTHLSVYGGSIYWTNGNGAIMTCGTDGSNKKMIATGPSGAKGISTDGNFVYWVARDNIGGYVLKVSTTGGNPEILVSGLMNPREVVVDNENVYWTDLDAGTIMRVAK